MNSLLETVGSSVDEEVFKLMEQYDRVSEAEESFEVALRMSNYKAGEGQRTGLSTYAKGAEDKEGLVSIYTTLNADVEHENAPNHSTVEVHYAQHEPTKPALAFDFKSAALPPSDPKYRYVLKSLNSEEQVDDAQASVANLKALFEGS